MEGKVDQLVALLTERMAAEGTPTRVGQSPLVTPEKGRERGSRRRHDPRL